MLIRNGLAPKFNPLTIFDDVESTHIIPNHDGPGSAVENGQTTALFDTEMEDLFK
jgi:hypothetical protein